MTYTQWDPIEAVRHAVLMGRMPAGRLLSMLLPGGPLVRRADVMAWDSVVAGDGRRRSA